MLAYMARVQKRTEPQKQLRRNPYKAVNDRAHNPPKGDPIEKKTPSGTS